MFQRDVVFPAGRQALYENNRYSPAIRSNGLLLVSGQVGALADGSVVADPRAQITQAFDNLNAVLAAAQCSFADVVDVSMYVVDPPAHLEAIGEVMARYWGPAPYPCLTAVGVTWLSGFMFEIKVTARLPQATDAG